MWGKLREQLEERTNDVLLELCYILGVKRSGKKAKKIQEILESVYEYQDVMNRLSFLEFGLYIRNSFTAEELTDITRDYDLPRHKSKWDKIIEIVKSEEVTPRTLLGQLSTEELEEMCSDLGISQDYSSLGTVGMIPSIILFFGLRWLEEIMESAFVMMAMTNDSEFEEVYQIIKSECKEFDITAERIDEVHSSGLITDEILEKIDSSEYLIVDLSLERPNVYYELGYSHGIGKDSKKIILMAKRGTKRHFDIRNMRTILYNDHNDLRKKLRERLEALKSAK